MNPYEHDNITTDEQINRAARALTVLGMALFCWGLIFLAIAIAIGALG